MNYGNETVGENEKEALVGEAIQIHEVETIGEVEITRLLPVRGSDGGTGLYEQADRKKNGPPIDQCE